MANLRYILSVKGTPAGRFNAPGFEKMSDPAVMCEPGKQAQLAPRETCKSKARPTVLKRGGFVDGFAL